MLALGQSYAGSFRRHWTETAWLGIRDSVNARILTGGLASFPFDQTEALPGGGNLKHWRKGKFELRRNAGTRTGTEQEQALWAILQTELQTARFGTDENRKN
ncbi:MAG: hypothetical protein BroJett013_26500 [Alphaproteobacteria bacterium]|nr:MAG: hypothetical protein BroJett013_26500 [Alphaproteobacteria bacterium]